LIVRSVIYSSFGNPADVLQVAERPTPNPGAGQVRIKSTLSPIHNHDLWTIRGQYGYKPQLPAVGGTEVAGVIDAIGEGVEHVKLGQRVVVAGIYEAWADYVLAPAAAVIPLPDAINDEVGCQLIAMPLSAVMLLEYLHLEPGQWFIQNTANGAVGKTLAMLANARGINVVNLVRRETGIAELAEVGIGNAVSTESDGWKKQVRGIVGDAPLAAGVDSVGGMPAATSSVCLAKTARWSRLAPCPVSRCGLTPATRSSSRRPSRVSGRARFPRSPRARIKRE
jgi:NADPH2:quinone reductase